MKIVSKKTITTVIWSNGTYSNNIRKELSVNMDDSDIPFDEIHDAVKDALRATVLKKNEEEALRYAP